MSDSKSLAAIVLIVSLYALYLHAQGRLVPLWRFTTNTPPQGVGAAAGTVSTGAGTVLDTIKQAASGSLPPFSVGGLKVVPIAPTTQLPQLPGP